MTIFLTGFPGFIATRLIERLANPQTRFFLLVQPAFVERAQAELEEISRRTNAPLENFYLFEGDITAANLGLSNEDLNLIQDETTDIHHLAAVYDLAVSRELAQSVNVNGTENVNNLVKKIKNLRRYNYVSTCYVAGKRTGVIYENELEHNVGFRNFYEETKYLAEVAVESLKKDFPVTIFRPSVVVGDSKTGETMKYDGIYYLILYLRKLPGVLSLFNIGNEKVKLNLVPVDFVANSIAALSKDETVTGLTLQIADPAPLTTRQLFDEISGAMTKRKSSIAFPTAVVETWLNSSLSPALTGLPHVGVPYFFIEQTYDTRVSQEALAPHGIACPPFPTYVENLLKFVEENPKL
jgi:thioester reductase-like protein